MALLEYGHPRRVLLSQLTWFGAWAAVTIVGAILSPDKSGHGTHQELGLPPCPSVLLFDRPCPGCGLTTSWTALIHGRFAEAFHAHPLGPPMYVLFTVSAFVSVYAHLRGAYVNTNNKSLNRAATVGVVVFIAFGLVRMAITPHFGTVSEHIMAQFAK